MLRILRVESEGGRFLLDLQGRIAGEWIDLLEGECTDAIRSGLRVALDLTGVTFIGRSGLEALRRLRAAGVEIGACSPLLADTLEQEGIAPGPVRRNAHDGNGLGKKGGATAV